MPLEGVLEGVLEGLPGVHLWVPPEVHLEARPWAYLGASPAALLGAPREMPPVVPLEVSHVSAEGEEESQGRAQESIQVSAKKKSVCENRKRGAASRSKAFENQRIASENPVECHAGVEVGDDPLQQSEHRHLEAYHEEEVVAEAHPRREPLQYKTSTHQSHPVRLGHRRRRPVRDVAKTYLGSYPGPTHLYPRPRLAELCRHCPIPGSLPTRP